MAIAEKDIQILKSEVLLDTDDGGGMATANAVEDNVSNNLFPDIPELSRAYGKVEFRKVYPAVVTDDTDILYGAQFLVTELPEDPNVCVSAFTTNSWNDNRKKAREHLETYLAAGTLASWELLETQLSGQRSILLMGSQKASPPTVGNTYLLVQSEGQAGAYQQYIRLTKVKEELRTFFDDGGTEFTLRVFTCDISDPLSNRYDGFTPQEFKRGQVSTGNGKARIRETRVADAAKYYSARKLSKPVNRGDATVNVDSIYTNLLPSAQSEVPLIDLSMTGQYSGVMRGANAVSFEMYISITTGANVSVVGSAITPETLTISFNGQTYKDDGVNQIKRGETVVGSIQYDTGQITWLVAQITGSGNATISYVPAFRVTQSEMNAVVKITEANRGLTYNYALTPPPAKGSLRMVYVFNGKHYTLYDNGDGTISGVTSGVGVGQINYSTGTVTTTLNAYPDIDSYLLYQWGTKPLELDTVSEQEQKAYALIDLPEGNVVFNRFHSLDTDPVFTWEVPNPSYNPSETVNPQPAKLTKTATVNKSTFEIAGDATGNLKNDGGRFYFNEVLPVGSTLKLSTVSTSGGEGHTLNGTISEAGGKVTIQLPLDVENFNPWSVNFVLPIKLESNEYIYPQAYSENTTRINLTQLNLYVAGGGLNGIYNIVNRVDGWVASDIQGTLNKNTMTITLTPRVRITGYTITTQKVNEWEAMFGATAGYRKDYHNATIYSTGFSGVPSSVGVLFKNDVVTNVPRYYDCTVVGYALNVTPSAGYTLSPVEVKFRIGGRSFALTDSNIVNTVASNGQLAQAGTVSGDPTTALTIKFDPAFPLNGIEVTWLSAGCVVTENPKSEFMFYSSMSPLRNGSFQLMVKQSDGSVLALVVGDDGRISHGKVVGHVDYKTGFIALVFVNRHTGLTQAQAKNVYRQYPELGDWDTNSDGAWIYDAITGTYSVMAPGWVKASSISYNAVGLVYLPLSPSILGLDPVRLPADGRVPCYREGDVVVLTESKTFEIVNPVSEGTFTAQDIRLSTFEIVDSTGRMVTEYVINMVSGSGGFTSAFDPTNYVLPLTAKYKIQDMALVTDVQVSGVLSMSKVISHSYSKNATLSSAIIINNMQARAYNKFHQSSWNSAWSDASSGGSAISANYNTVYYPVQVTNRGAIKERWAIVFTSSSQFRCIGEFVGEIGAGSVSEDFAPINPFTGTPYFTIKKEGWGSGWSPSYVMRFNTEAANFPIWIVRTILQSEESDLKDRFVMQLRGDIDNPD